MNTEMNVSTLRQTITDETGVVEVPLMVSGKMSGVQENVLPSCCTGDETNVCLESQLLVMQSAGTMIHLQSTHILCLSSLIGC